MHLFRSKGGKRFDAVRPAACLGFLPHPMEVHHHPKSHAGGWKAHLLEFGMLFAAVTLGFFAENLREHHVEGQREVKFIETVHADVLADIEALRTVIPSQEQRLKHEETLLRLLERHGKEDLSALYYAGRVTSLRYFFIRSKNGFQQLKYAGGLRLIADMEIVRALQVYEGEIDKLEELQGLTEGLLNHVEVAIRAYDPCLSCATHAVGRMPLEVELLDAAGSRVSALARDGRATIPHAGGGTLCIAAENFAMQQMVANRTPASWRIG